MQRPHARRPELLLDAAGEVEEPVLRDGADPGPLRVQGAGPAVLVQDAQAHEVAGAVLLAVGCEQPHADGLAGEVHAASEAARGRGAGDLGQEVLESAAVGPRQEVCEDLALQATAEDGAVHRAARAHDSAAVGEAEDDVRDGIPAARALLLFLLPCAGDVLSDQPHLPLLPLETLQARQRQGRKEQQAGEPERRQARAG
mmetsp:Transcript_88279/g.246952  ORF Transcript_88279/g.246952 Transcript_88279/m.246952 type:complete len:200 (-) Transcript_88279:309-908(-)